MSSPALPESFRTPEAIEGHDGLVTALTYRQSDGSLATGAIDGVARAWERPGARRPVWSVATSAGGLLILDEL